MLQWNVSEVVLKTGEMGGYDGKLKMLPLQCEIQVLVGTISVGRALHVGGHFQLKMALIVETRPLVRDVQGFRQRRR